MSSFIFFWFVFLEYCSMVIPLLPGFYKQESKYDDRPFGVKGYRSRFSIFIKCFYEHHSPKISISARRPGV
jgi:hypothetical protein